MRIVNPSFGLEAGSEDWGKSVEKGLTDWSRDPIALISNSKANARELLEGLRDQMGVFRSTDNVDYFSKSTSSKPAPEALYDEVAKSYKGAIVGLAD